MGRPDAIVADTTGQIVDLRIMATSDLHMHILPFDYVTGRPSITTGLARTAALVRTARLEASNAILLDNGDFLHGSPMSEAILRDDLRGRRAPRHRHPIVAAMGTMGYDAVTLGNHDFDHGAEYLGQVLEKAPFLVVASNLRLLPVTGNNTPGPLPFTLPFTVLEREAVDRSGQTRRIRIGLLGFLPPGSITGLRKGPFAAEIHDIVETARAMALEVRALGADIVVAMAHSGIGDEAHRPGMENAVIPLAAIPEIDAIMSGHAHQVFPDLGAAFDGPANGATGHIHETPVVAPGFWGSHLGVIDLALEPTPRAGWRVVHSTSETRPIAVRDPGTGQTRARVKPDRAITDLLEGVHETVVGSMRTSVGTTHRRLHSYFSVAAPSPALDIVHRAMLWFGTRHLAGSELSGLPLLASTSPFKAGGLAGPEFFTDIAPGPITVNALSDLYRHPNGLSAIRLTGAELQDWLERAASVFNRIEPDHGDQSLLPRTSPAYGFETVAGCDYRIDLSAPARYTPRGELRNKTASRIRDLSIDGQPLPPDRELILLTSSFRMAGGGRYPVPDREGFGRDLSSSIPDVLAEYLASTPPHAAPPLARWSFAPVPGARVAVRSAPNATQVLDELHGRSVTPGEIDAEGFRIFRFTV